MQALQLIKTHLVVLLCGVVAIAAVVGAVLGMTRGTVVKEMKAEISRIGAASISDLRSKPQNAETIAAVKRRGEKFQTEYDETEKVAHTINSRDVLMSGVFPQPETTTTKFKFKEAYQRAMKLLPTKLAADTLPTEADIREEAQNVEDLLLLEAEQKAEEEEEEGSRAPRVATGGRRPVVPPPGAGRFAPLPPMYGGGRVGPGLSGRVAPGMLDGMAPEPVSRGARIPTAKSGEPKYNATYRAQVAKAKSILCYYDEGSFHHSPLEYLDAEPTAEEMWYAQVVAWVQEDVVEAIKELNDAAVQATDDDACVEHVPVKRVVFLRVRGYQGAGPQGFIPFPERGGAGAVNVPPPGPSLTGRKSNEQYDVVRFVVSVVIDQRDILQLIDRISRVNFYQCLSASYEALVYQQEMAQGYFYGTDPVVRATFEFEGYMAREVYEKWMPSAVRQALGIDAAEGEGD